MEYIPNKFSATILLGGLSSRMGRAKHQLRIGNQTFLSQIEQSLKPLEVNYSVHELTADLNPSQQICDLSSRMGPIGGIYSSLLATNSEYLLIASCDIPLISHELVRYLIASASLEQKTVIARVHDKVMPTFAVYHKTDLPLFAQAIAQQDYKLMNVLDTLDCHYLDIPKRFAGELQNINTPSDYQQLQQPFVFSVSGFKNSGKTTLITKLISHFQADKLNVAILKHDGHDFTIPTDTDTGKFINKQANHVTIYSKFKQQTTSYQSFDLATYLTSLSNINVVIIEGMKDADFPKVIIESTETINATNPIIVVDQHTRNNTTEIYQAIRKEMNDR